jgi:tetratricopeptide (TPR) repeat protein
MADLVQGWPWSRTALTGVAALALSCCLAATRSQVEYWQNNITLNEHALKATSGNYIAHSNLGYALMDESKYDEAVKQFQEVIRLKPLVAAPYNDLGTAYASQKKLDDAMAMFLKATQLNSELEEAHYNLGNAYIDKGKPAEGIAELKTALHLKPNDLKAQKTLADALIKTGQTAEAIPYCEALVANEPEDAHARFNLGWACQAAKRPEEALTHYKEAMRLAPDSPQCLNALAWMYATSAKAAIRNGTEAVRLAERAAQITQRQNTQLLDTLAAAYAEAGRFDEAVKTTEEIHALAISTHDTGMAETARQRLELYQAGKPYRDEQ